MYANDNSINGSDPSGFSTITEVLNFFDILSQLAAQTYTGVVTPVAIDLAKYWAVIIGLASISLLVVEEKNERCEMKFKVIPDERSNSKFQSTVRQDSNRMKLQLQNAEGKIFGIPMYHTPQVGVTVLQVKQAVLTLRSFRRSCAKWLPKSHETALIKAMSGVTKTAEKKLPIWCFCREFSGLLPSVE